MNHNTTKPTPTKQRDNRSHPLNTTITTITTIITLALLPLLTPTAALALPEGRTYEMVSPPYKGGYAASSIVGVSTNGENVAFESQGTFNGEPSDNGITSVYLARRGTTGWTTVPVMPPATIGPFKELESFSKNLETWLFRVKPGPNIGAAADGTTVNEFTSYNAQTPDTDVDWELQGVPLEGFYGDDGFEGASPDFSHILVEVPSLDDVMSLDDLVTSGEGSPSLQMVGAENKVGVHDEAEPIGPQCPLVLGSDVGKRSKFNAVAADGSEIFFTANVNAQSTGCGNEQLFVRLDGTKTLEVSRRLEGCGDGGKPGEVPGEVPCPGATSRPSAEFDGASEDGSRVFFTTKAPLVAEDKDKANDLYMTGIGCPTGEPECEVGQKEVTSLVQVSHDPNTGEAADVQGVVSVSPDGSRVYFVAGGVLSTTPSVDAQGYGVNGKPVVSGAVAQPGADNLYVYESSPSIQSGTVRFIADLCSSSGLSGTATDEDCPSDVSGATNDTGIWLTGAVEAQLADEGGFLVFTSYGQLVANDTDTAKDVYRYDAETGTLVRVSTGENGTDANGNNGEFDATIAISSTEPGAARVISENGSRIVFTTAEPLSEAAVNHLANVYEWHMEPGWSEGRVSLISSGSSTEPVNDVAISPSGDDVFFVTSQSVLPQDTDGANDIYDARLGEGFPSSPAESQRCSSDACQSALATPAPLLVPGSVSQVPGGNLAPPVSKPVLKVKVKSKRKKAKPKKRSTASRKKGKRSGRTGKTVDSSGRDGR